MHWRFDFSEIIPLTSKPGLDTGTEVVWIRCIFTISLFTMEIQEPEKIAKNTNFTRLNPGIQELQMFTCMYQHICSVERSLFKWRLHEQLHAARMCAVLTQHCIPRQEWQQCRSEWTHRAEGFVRLVRVELSMKAAPRTISKKHLSVWVFTADNSRKEVIDHGRRFLFREEETFSWLL